MPKWEYKERQARLRFPLLVSPILNFLHSHDDCSSIARCCRRIAPRLIVFDHAGRVTLPHWLVPFIVSFHDLRLLRNEGVAQYAEHLIVINAVFAIVPFVPRLKIPSGVEVHQFGRLHVALHKNEFAADNFPCRI